MIDLHLHTQASDGSWTPARMVREAAKIGLRAIAFTDHDSMSSVDEGLALAKEAGLRFLAGVEITASLEGAEFVHLLGYGVDGRDARLRAVLAANQAAWAENERRSLENLAKLGIHISKERYDYWACHREPGGWPTLNCLVELGLVKGHRDYFDKYFGLGRPAYVETIFADPAEVIGAIKTAGGVPVLAHPGAYDPAGRTVLDRPGFLDGFVRMGLEGLEAFANENSPAVTEHLLTYCREHDLLVTGGSDCHGEFVAGRILGRPPVPDEYLPPLLARLKRGSYV